ncbi:hypothetical protein OSB04_030039 [Centaurea solstitialis]|uniref:Cyclic nucleotide-binding domain-containing protein n=1 Tax=Centaurea solstitialis TaxID=347529 RepID=A0AA38W6R3_9ASTR|nr:hypothetical protein OSB04_030039 [Centaurea solstitialis]
MDFKKEKQVRFYNGETGKSNFEWQIPDKQFQEHKLSSSAPLLINGIKGRPMPISNGIKLGKSRVHPEESNDPKGKRILDPGSEVILQWNRIFLFSCLVALFVDPLFFYLPSVQKVDGSSCMMSDLNLGIVVTCLRTIADAFYMLHIAIKFRTAYVSPSSRVLGRGELVMDPEKIAWRYLKSDFFIDLVATLPLPQIVIWFIIPAIRTPNADHTTNALVLIVLLQYLPRFYLIFPLSSQIIRATGVVTKTAWAGAAYNLVLYMLASHGHRGTCCHLNGMRRVGNLLAEMTLTRWLVRFVIWIVVLQATTTERNGPLGRNFSVFVILTKIRVQVRDIWRCCCKRCRVGRLLRKVLLLPVVGITKLENLSTSTFIGETSFAILIAIMGLVLFAHLIGNMQTYLQSITIRLEEWRLRRRDTEEWMRHRQLPNDLQERVRKFVQYKWLATRGVDEESILHALPTDLRRDIQRHLCLDLVRRVPFFSQMDDQLLDAICERLVSSLSTQGTYIVREGDPVSEMLFIIRGRLDSSTTNGGRTGFFNSITLRPGDFCGEELLAWALLPKSTLNLPSSTRTVKALNEVEAFALRAEDLKFVANQFRRLHSKKLQHTFRFYSYHWRTWAACFIQAAWRRIKKRRMAWNLSMSESSYRPDDDDDDNERSHETEHSEEAGSYNPNSAMQNLNVTILASRFAANTRRGMLKTKDVELIKLQKPEEPDYSADPDDD